MSEEKKMEEMPVADAKVASTTPVEKKEKEAQTKEKGKKKGKKLLIVAISLIIFVILIGGGFGSYWLVYSYDQENVVQEWLVNTFPLPVAKVNGEALLISDVQSAVDSTSRFLESEESVQLGLSDSIAQSDIADLEYERLVIALLLEQYAAENDIEVTDEEVDAYFDEVVLPQAPGGIAEIEQVFSDLYGWTVDDFKQNIAREVVLRQKIDSFLLNKDGGGAEERAQALYEEIQNNPEKSFSDFAKEYSQDPGSAVAGGSLGTFGRGAMVPEFEEAAFALEVGEISEPVKSDFGYHIIRVTAKNEEEDTVEASHILLRAETAQDIIEQLRDEATIREYKPAYLF